MPDRNSALTSAGFAAITGVSRETIDRLAAYLDLLKRWQSRINLVSASSLSDPWRRHFLDSAQLFPLLGPGPTYDIGSGAGFPGLVLAILGHAGMHLVESDQRKAAFLREAGRITGANIHVRAVRAEDLSPESADFVVARAVAPLTNLLSIAVPLLRRGGICVALKGKSAADELNEARKSWTMRIERRKSISDPSGVILRLEEIRHV